MPNILQEELGGLAEKARDTGLTDAERRDLAAAFGSFANEQTNPLGRLADDLADAGRSLDRSDPTSAADSLDAAADSLGSLKERLNNLRTLSEMIDHLSSLKRLAMSSQSREDSDRELAMRTTRQEKEGGSGSSVGRPVTADALAAERAESTDMAETAGPPDPSADGEGVGNAAVGPGIDEPTHLPDAGVASRVEGELSAQGDIPSVILRSARFAGNASVPYRQAHRNAMDLLESALTGERIPRAQTELVRRYFDLIAPPDDTGR